MIYRQALAQRVDWFRLLADLRKAGISSNRLEELTGIASSTIRSWSQGIEPSHSSGEMLVSVWVSETGRHRADVPLTSFVMSAARAK